MRNSSPVERGGAENVAGLKPGAEAAGSRGLRASGAVGERSQWAEAEPRGEVDRWEVRMPE